MKKLNVALSSLVGIGLAALIAASPAHANKGGESGGGGDIECDGLVKKIAGNLETWIKNGGPEAGKLDLSSSLNPATGQPYTYAEYNSKMTTLLELPLDVSCVKPGDKGYPVDVDDSAKICKTSVDASGVHMICDRALFLGLKVDSQIEQNHHEFAINVPGLEPDTGPISTYKISTQLSDSIDTVIERRLVVRNGQSSVDLLGKSIDEALRAATFTIRLNKEIYFSKATDSKQGVAVIQNDTIMCTWRAQAHDKLLSCTNPDGSPREIELSQKNVDSHFHEQGFLSNSNHEFNVIDINTGLDFAPKMQCTTKSSSTKRNNAGLPTRVTMGELLDALSVNFDLTENPQPNHF